MKYSNPERKGVRGEARIGCQDVMFLQLVNISSSDLPLGGACAAVLNVGRVQANIRPANSLSIAPSQYRHEFINRIHLGVKFCSSWAYHSRTPSLFASSCDAVLGSVYCVGRSRIVDVDDLLSARLFSTKYSRSFWIGEPPHTLLVP